ncbi:MULTISPECIES: RloB family protein [Bacteroidales]|uniref:RloB family protein n=2 Tax=Bacteroidales TaxID=171549 RepID=A0ABV4D056_9BACT|nr:RloB family protein [Bacteroides acidifaciens]
MKIDKLNYAKGELSKEIKEGSPVLVPETQDSADVSGLEAVSSDYSKGAPYISTRIVFILSGGTKREKDYFRPLRSDSNIRSIKIAFRSKEGQGLKPYELKGLAEEFLNSKRFITEDNNSFKIEEGDILYLLQDVDEFADEIKGYLSNIDTQLPLQWIVSNPSFEIWLFYHYYDSPDVLKDGVTMSEHDRSNWLKEYLNTVVSGGIKTTQALYTAEVAIINSRKNYIENNRFPALYSTQMHVVVESILSIMGNEFPEMKIRQAERIAYYKKLSQIKDITD